MTIWSNQTLASWTHGSALRTRPVMRANQNISAFISHQNRTVCVCARRAWGVYHILAAKAPLLSLWSCSMLTQWAEGEWPVARAAKASVCFFYWWYLLHFLSTQLIHTTSKLALHLFVPVERHLSSLKSIGLTVQEICAQPPTQTDRQKDLPAVYR